jgi:hypothetical protein
MIVLDQSASMTEAAEANGPSKWDVAVAAVKKLVGTYPEIHFGLTLFSGLGECASSPISVGIGPDGGSEIPSRLPQVPEGTATPISAGLNVAAQDPALGDQSRSSAMVLITDGNENCGGVPVAEVQSRRRQTPSLPTYSVAFANGVNAAALKRIAIQGGTARLGAPRYYEVNRQDDLDAALTAISSSARVCSLTLSQTGLEPSKVFVGINNQLVPHDPNRLSGWDYEPTTSRVRFYGPACDALVITPSAHVQVNYGCSGDLVDGGVDGGFDFGL